MIINLKNVDLALHKKNIEKNGFTILRDVFSKNFLREIEKESLKLSWQNIHNGEINVISTSEKCTLSSSHNLVQLSKKYKSLYFDDDIKNFFYKVIGEEPDLTRMINSSYFFKVKESKEIKLHQDNAYFNLNSGINCLTFYIPVHYQSRKCGTIFYFKGSHKVNLLEHEPLGNLGTSMCLKKNNYLKTLKAYKIDYLELNPGDVCVHNALVVHGTLPNPKNFRCEAFNFSLYSKGNNINIEKYHQYKKLLNRFLEEKRN